MTNQEYSNNNDMVRRIAKGLTKKCDHLYEDAISEGWVGLLEAVSRRTEDMSDLEFECFAYQRIRGAVLDFLRKQDFLTRPLRKLWKQINSIQTSYLTQYGRPADMSELSEILGIPVGHLEKRVADMARIPKNSVDIHDTPIDSEELSPEALVVNRDAETKAYALIRYLPKEKQVVANMVYVDDLPNNCVGQVLGVSETMVSIHKRDLVKFMRKRMGV